MKTRIDQLLKGEFDYEMPELLFSRDKVYVSVAPGGTYQGEVYLGTEDNRRIRGYITSSDRRLVPGYAEFSGTTIRLPFGVDGVGLELGEKRTEWLCFTTNIGEYRLPFLIETREEGTRTLEEDEIRTPENLAALASGNFREAHRVFTSPGFKEVLKKCTGAQLSLYAGLSVPPVTYQSLEEFLIALGLKERVEISLPEYRREVYDLRESSGDSLRILRSGWGHLRLEIDVQGDFIELEKRIITDEDFIGSTCSLNYVLNVKSIGKGIHYGRILIRSPYQELVFEMEVSREIRTGVDVRMGEKKRRLGLCRDFLDYQTGRAEKSAWLVSSHYELNQLKEFGCDYPEYLLYEAFVMLQEDKTEEAAEVLTAFRDRSYAKDDIELAGIYLYLCVLTGLYKDTEGALRRIQGFYKQKENSIWLLLILLYFDPEYAESPSRALIEMESMFERGVHSPFLYLEAMKRIRRDESLLRHLGRFWIQVFWFGARNHFLTEELAMRFAYLSGYERKYNECVYRALEAAYDSFQSDDTLEAICRYIMLDNPRKKEYFRWYSLAVPKGIRLTRLYEYYMETMDISYRRALPRPVLMYFNYNNDSMGENRMAFLYASITENRGTDAASYASYEQMMEEFARKRLYEGKISEDLAVLYRNFCSVPETPEDAGHLAQVCYCRRLYCDSREVRAVVVRHRQLVREEIYPVIRGVAYPVIYTKDAAVLFQDARQRRYAATVEYSILPLLDEYSLTPGLLEKGVLKPGVLLAYCSTHEISLKNINYFRAVVDSGDFTEEYRNEIRRRILRFYRSDPRGESLNINTKQMNFRDYAAADRKGLLEVLTMRGLYEEAYRIVEEFGTEGLDSSALLRITSRMILKNEMQEEDELVALASEVYHNGIYDETILEYLMLHRYGPVEELLRIRKSAMGFDLDVYSFEEKLLGILMLTQDYRKEGEGVLEHYEKSAGKERVVGAYLTQISYGYLVKDYNISPFIRKALEKSWQLKWPVDRICRYALFKSIVREKDPKDRYLEMKKELLAECRERGYCFSFFRRLPESLLSLYQLDDKTFVECHADPEASVTLYYQMETGLTPDNAFHSKPVPTMYEGIYTSMFTLFYGDTLKYYFEIEKNGEVRKTPERTIRMNRADSNGSSRYQLINHLLASHKLGKDQETVTGLKQYLRQQQYVEHMFIPDMAVHGRES